MEPPKLRYGLEDRPPAGETLLYALQWVALSLPFVVLLGTVAAGHHGYADGAERTLYLQKGAFAAGLMMLAQSLFGHRLPLVAGSSTALLLGIVGTAAPPDAVYTASALCGLLLAALSGLGLFRALMKLFTPRVTAAVILLIAFTMTPTIVRLLAGGGCGAAPGRLAFSAVFVAALLLAHRLLPAAARSLLVVGGMAAGTAAFLALFGGAAVTGDAPLLAPFLSDFTTPTFDPGALLSFLFCFLALSLNEAGSIRSLVPLLAPEGMEGRAGRGMTVTGIVNAVAGFMGVVGPVDFSLSPGVIAATGCGSRFPLVPAAALLVVASFSPALIGVAAAVPPTVVGGILVYALAGQVAAGLSAATSGGAVTFEDGLVLGLPLLAGTVTSFLPPEALAGIPPLVRPVAGNGFVVGVVAVLLLDRLFRRPA